MKKVITFCLVLSVILAALSACDDKNDIIPIDEPSRFQLIDGSEIPLNVQYIQTKYFVIDDEYPLPITAIIVSSREEFEQYYEKNKNYYDYNGKFSDAKEKYTDDYFADNFLLIVRVIEGGSYVHRVERVDETGDIVIKQFSVLGPTVMTAWSIVIEFDNDYKKEEYRVSIVD